MEHLRLRITGRVQGISFRWYAKQEADRLGVAGYAKNLPDGSVEICAEGSKPAVEQFLDWCRKGPPHAVVESVEILAQENAKGMSGFRCLRRDDREDPEA